jgi:aminoglycoside phosphotransferase (APT) family kinase protein
MVPSSVVHGDFSALNIRFVDRNGTSRLMPIDWEKSGWGMPFVDFVRGLDIDNYAAQVATYWPNVRRASVERMLTFSRLLRPLTHQWEKKSAAKIEAYYVSMQDALTSLGWR